MFAFTGPHCFGAVRPLESIATEVDRSELSMRVHKSALVI